MSKGRLLLEVELREIEGHERALFLEMAESYFQELAGGNAAIDVTAYVDRVLENDESRARWIIWRSGIAGFTVWRSVAHCFRSYTLGLVEEFYVEPSARRKGVGKAAARALLAELAEEGSARVDLHVLLDNPAASAFWRACGFRPRSIAYRRELSSE